MKLILHLGAQRSATTTLQHYLRENERALKKQGVAVWEPRKLRNGGLFDGLYSGPNRAPSKSAILRARSRIAREMNQLKRSGAQALFVSEENALGSVKGNLRQTSLYPNAARRLRALALAFGRPLDKVILGVRGQEQYWPSALAYAVKRGAQVPDDHMLRAIAGNMRSWRDVIEDIHRVFGNAAIEVHRFEDFADVPDLRLGLALGGRFDLPAFKPRMTYNAAPDLPQLRALLADRGLAATLPEGEGTWQPFSAGELAKLREAYQDDLFWATGQSKRGIELIEMEMPREAGQSLPLVNTRGLSNDKARRMGRAG